MQRFIKGVVRADGSALLPASATIIGAVVLDQIPTARDLIGIALVIGGVSWHRPAR